MHALSHELEDDELRRRLRVALLRTPDPAALLTEMEGAYAHHRLVGAAALALAEPVWGEVDLRQLGAGLVTGSGGVALRTVNVSTAASLTAAGVDGVRIVKCGSRSSRAKGVGPVGVLGSLGMRPCENPAQLVERIERRGFALLDSSAVFPWLHDELLCTFPFLVEARARVRFDAVRTSWKVNGIADLAALEPSLRSASPRRTAVVSGATDRAALRLDDPSTAGTTTIVTVDADRRTEVRVEPETVGFSRVDAEAWCVPARLDAGAALRMTLEGSAPRAWIELVAFAAGLLVSTALPDVSLHDGCREALARLIRGEPARALEKILAAEARA